MPLLQRLSKRVGCRIWDAIKAKLKEVLQKEKIDKTLVDYVFVLFDPINDAQTLNTKLADFLGGKTEVFVEWFTKVISQVDNQVAKAQAEVGGSTKNKDKNSISTAPQQDKDEAAEACLDNILLPKHTSNSDASGQEQLDPGKTYRDRAEKGVKAEHITDVTDGRRKKNNYDEDDETSDRVVDHGATRAASRMLTKAAKEAVRSVQAVGTNSVAASHHAPSVSPKRASPRRSPSRERSERASVENGDASPLRGNSMEAEQSESLTAQDEGKGDHVLTIAVDADEEESFPTDDTLKGGNDSGAEAYRGEPISVKMGGRKRGYDDRREKLPAHSNVVPVQPVPMPAPSRAFRRESPLIVHEKEIEPDVENMQDEDEDPNNIPGLLVVMPVESSDHMNRIIMDDFNGKPNLPWYNRGQGMAPPGHLGYPPLGPYQAPRFAVSGIGRSQPPLHQLHPGKNNFYDEMEDGEGGAFHGPPAKRFRPGPGPYGPPDTSTILCRFLPHCAKKAGVCPFYHPVCRNGKFCRYGATCVFDHSSAPPAGMDTGDGPAGPDPNAIVTRVPLCMYFPFCTQPRCKFLHKQPVVCSFGTQCRMGALRCAYLHPEDMASPATSNNGMQIGDYEDDSEMGEAEHSISLAQSEHEAEEPGVVF